MNSKVKFDDSVKSRFLNFSVIPLKTGILLFQADMDSRFRGNDGVSDFLHIHQILTFEKDEVIFDLNGTAENLYGVVSGEVELFITFWDKRMSATDIRNRNSDLLQIKILQMPIVVAKIRAGEILGWSSMLNHKRWTAPARSRTFTHIVSLPAVYLKNILFRALLIGCICMEKLCDIILRISKTEQT